MGLYVFWRKKMALLTPNSRVYIMNLIELISLDSNPISVLRNSFNMYKSLRCTVSKS